VRRALGRAAILALAAGLLRTSANAQTGAPTPAPPPAVAAADFQRLCSGHVAAVPRPDGRPGPHLEWIAYTSAAAAEELARRHRAELAGGEHETGADGCHVWRFSDSGRHIWDLCPVEVEGPAARCVPPAGTRSVLLVSTMVGGD
jgi:hypothetical protein